MTVPWRFCGKSAVQLWLPTLLLVVTAKGGALFAGYSIDDYGLITQRAVQPSLMLAQGRFGQAAITYLFHGLGLVPPHAGIFFPLLGIASSVLLGVAVARFWNLRPGDWRAVAAATVVAIHPFTTELFTFRTANGSSSLAYALVASAILVRPRSPRTIAVSALLFTLALSIYQVVFNYVVMAVLMGVAIGLARWSLSRRPSERPERFRRLLAPGRQLRGRNMALCLSFAIALAGYALAGALVGRLFHVVATPRSALLAPDDWRARAGEVADVLHQRILGPSPLVPELTKRLLLLILVMALVGPAVRIGRGRSLRSIVVFAVNALLLAAALVWSVGLAMLLKDFWPAPRVMPHLGVFWAGALVIATLGAGPRIRAGIGLVASLVVLSFIGSDNRILDDQLRLNMRDLALANRELARLERLPGIAANQTLALVGAVPTAGLSLATTDHDLNITAFAAPWSKIGILRELAGRDFLLPTDAKFSDAKDACAGAESFPGNRSIFMKEDLAIVCLGPSH